MHRSDLPSRRLALTIASLLLLALLSLTRDAHASLTASEKAQVRDYTTAARVQDAARVRALAARPDLTADESAQAMVGALDSIPWNEARAVFIRELLFGAASAASRAVLVPAVVRGLVARADNVFQRYSGQIDRDPRATTEILAIYAYATREIAQRQEGVPERSRADAMRAIADHIERNAHWLKYTQPTASSVVPTRVQATIALASFSPDTATRRVDTADAVDLKGSRRRILIDWGLLVGDTGNAPDSRVDKLRALLERMPVLHADVAVIVFGDEHTGVVARRQVIAVKRTLEDSAVLASPWSEEVNGATFDADFSGPTRDLELIAVRRTLDNRGDLRVQIERDGAHADKQHPFGAPVADAADARVAAAVDLLIMDAPRAFDWAFARNISGNEDGALFVSDALGVLGAYAQSQGSAGLSVPLARDIAGHIETIPATALRLDPNGTCGGFTFDGHVFAIERDAATGNIVAIKRDGAAVTLGELTYARVPTSDASTWTYGGVTFTRLRGAPRAGIGPGPHVRLLATGEHGYDAITTTAPAEDYVVEADLSIAGSRGGIAIRASTGRDALKGGLMMLIPGDAPRIALVTAESDGHESFMAAPYDAAFSVPIHVKITVRATKVDAEVGGAVFHGTLPASMHGGGVALFAAPGTVIEANRFVVRRIAEAVRPAPTAHH